MTHVNDMKNLFQSKILMPNGGKDIKYHETADSAKDYIIDRLPNAEANVDPATISRDLPYGQVWNTITMDLIEVYQ